MWSENCRDRDLTKPSIVQDVGVTLLSNAKYLTSRYEAKNDADKASRLDPSFT